MDINTYLVKCANNQFINDNDYEKLKSKTFIIVNEFDNAVMINKEVNYWYCRMKQHAWVVAIYENLNLN